MTSYCLDVELFINEVQKFPEIWDINSEDYRYKNRKQRAWAEIARLFITDFDDMPDIEKIDVYRKLHGKWRNIRDSFVRNIKKRYGKKGYMYAKHLTFLNNVYKSHSGSDGEAENADNDSSQPWQSDTEETPKLKKLAYKQRRFQILNESNIWQSDAEDTPSTIDNLKRRRIDTSKQEETNIEFVDTPFPDATCSYNVEDEDRSFFESLLPAVREFNIDQKLEFRSEIISLIKSIRSKSQNTHTPKFKLDPSTGDFDE